MCGRYTLAAEPDELLETFDVPELRFDYRPRYNIAPGQDAPVVAEDRRGRRIGLLTWGLVPAWREEPGSGIVNARAESVAVRPSFREAFARRRCLLPADGFYEWRREGEVKVPYWYRPAAGGLLAFAGVWERWTRPGHDARHTFTVLTTAANEDVRPIHDRMPALVPRDAWDSWLDVGTGMDALRATLRPAEAGTLAAHRVSTRVNRTSEDDPSLIGPA